LDHLYPDVVEAGTLVAALNEIFAKLGVELTAEWGLKSPWWAVTARGQRTSQLAAAKEQRLFLGDLSQDGVGMGRFQTPDLERAADITAAWLAKESDALALSAGFTEVIVSDRAALHATGPAAEVESEWTSLLQYIEKELPALLAVAVEAFRTPRLRELFPFCSHTTLCFSRCTGYPFTNDCPCITPGKGNAYEVRLGEASLGSGNAAEAVRLVVASLPVGCGPARRGTAEGPAGAL
jgi:hypothetical protein